MSITLALKSRLVRGIRWIAVLAIAPAALVPLTFAQTDQLQRTLTVSPTDPVTLEIDISKGDIQVLYSRDGELTIAGVAQAAAGSAVDNKFFQTVSTINQDGNHVRLRQLPNSAYSGEEIRVHYRIDVPYRTEVRSRVGNGRQTFSGITGPVKSVGGKGDFAASYISRGVQADADSGNFEFQVIGERVDARTGSGNISCTRVAQGVSAETGDGDIRLTVVGPSTATVTQGSGRIEVGGIRGRIAGSTHAGDIHIKAVPRDIWQLSTASGNIRLELPPAAQFDLDASTESGQLQLDRDDIHPPEPGVRHLQQQVNGGGSRIEVRSETGRIVIQ